ncbi:MAG: HTH-type transcriptional regulator MalT [Kangiellaceae bacterium]|nr:HTH-type transcriptional regulator MalT [Kangiellaceae bacterium]
MSDSKPSPLLLLSSKITLPELPSTSIIRQRLHVKFQDVISRPLTLICSPAGTGKTTLALHWCRSWHGRILWYSLDEQDNEAALFAAYWVTALKKVGVALDEKVVQIALRGQFENLNSLVTHILNSLNQQVDPLLMVFDDYHVISDRRIHQAMRFLVQHLPSFVRLAIISRTEPDIGVATLRVNNALSEINNHDLNFTQDEAREFFSLKIGESIQTDVVDLAVNQVGGWAAGLQLLALSANSASGLANIASRFDGTHLHLLDYLGDEVLSQQPQDISRFLLLTSVANRFNADLAQHLTGQANATQILMHLVRNSLFISPTEDEQSWYVYHPLFLSFLRHQLQQHFGDQLPELHLKAFCWWRYQGYFGDAAHHALQAGDQRVIAELLEQIGWDLFHYGQSGLLNRCLEALDDTIVASSVELTLLKASVVKIINKDARNVEPCLSAAERSLPDRLTDEEWRQVQGKFSAIRAMVAMCYEKHDEGATLAGHALDMLPANDNRLRASAMATLGEIHLKQGRLDDALNRFCQSEKIAHAGKVAEGELWAMHLQAETEYSRANLQQAYQLQTQSIQLAQSYFLDSVPDVDYVYRQRASVLLEWYRLEEARQCCQSSLDLTEYRGDYWLLPVYSLLIRIHLARGEYSEAERLLNINTQLYAKEPYHSYNQWQYETAYIYWHICNKDSAPLTQWLDSQPDIRCFTNIIQQGRGRNQAIALYVTGHLTQAQSQLALQIAAAREFQLTNDLIQNLFWLAKIQNSQNNQQGVLESLSESLSLGFQVNYLGSFLESRCEIKSLFEPLMDVFPEQARQHAKRLIGLAQFAPSPSRAPQIPQVVKEHGLTEREWDILQLIHQGLKNDQICQRLHIAQSTLKTHINRSYQKLGSSRRRDAIVKIDKIVNTIATTAEPPQNNYSQNN